MIKAKRKLLKPKDYDIVMQNPSPNLRQVVYYVDEDEDIEPVKHPSKHQYTNNELATMIVDLSKRMNDAFERVNARIDDTNKRMDAGFKQVNDRLNYIVAANNLKDLPKK